MTDYTVFCSILLACVCLSFGQQFGGEVCTLESTGNSGMCTELGNCPSAIAALQNQVLPQTCGFSGSVPIVCCEGSGNTTPRPTTTSTTTKRTTTRPRTTTRRPSQNLAVGDKSNQKCAEYASYVYEFIRPPIFGYPDLVNVSVCGFTSVPLIIGGVKAKPKEFPHQVALGYGEEDAKIWQCGGTLISDQFVLTAGHCTNAQEQGPVKWVRLGDLNLVRTNEDARPEEFNVAEIIKHPEYKPPQQYNDIALLKMDKAVKFNRWIRPACLQTTFKIDSPTKTGTNPRYIATGWGRVEFGGSASADLLKVVLDNFTQDQCNNTYKSTTKRRLAFGIVPESQLCAGGTDEEKDTCQGDSGGPLQVFHQSQYCMYKVVGVTSFGKTCGVKLVPGVYTRVSNYVDWIEKTVWP